MKKPADDIGKIARSASMVSIAVMCSRVLGLVREQAFAIMFGRVLPLMPLSSPSVSQTFFVISSARALFPLPS